MLMSLLTRLRKHWRAGIATFIAGSMLAGGVSAAFANGDNGQSGDNTQADMPAYGDWHIEDRDYPPTIDSFKIFLDHMGVKYTPNDGGQKVQQALQNAINESNQRAGHATHNRLVAVGIAVSHDSNGKYYFQDNKVGAKGIDEKLDAQAKQNLTYNGVNYNGYTTFRDGTSIVSRAHHAMTVGGIDTGDFNVGVIVLNDEEPPNHYHVDVSTNAHPGKMYLRNNEPVYDTVHTRVTKGQWPAGNKLGATVWLNYEPGQGASAQPAKAVRHDFTINHVGDTNTPQL